MTEILPTYPYIDDQSSTNSKSTYILRWNPALSRYFPLSSFESHMNMFDYKINLFPMRIMNWEKVHGGDIVYMVREGEGITGIVLRGIIMDEPHTYKDWCTEDSASRLIDIHVTQMMHPDKAKLPDTSQLEERWNMEESKGYSYPILIDKQTAEELDDLFSSYLRNNKEQFAVNKNNGVAITDFKIE